MLSMIYAMYFAADVVLVCLSFLMAMKDPFILSDNFGCTTASIGFAAQTFRNYDYLREYTQCRKC